MTLFQALHTATSGASVARVWIDAIADNVANMNTTRGPDEEPFRARQVIAESVTDRSGVGRGVRVQRIADKPGDPIVVFDPTNPLADEFGLVRQAQVDIGEEMTNLLLANRVYGMNITVVQTAVDSYRAALRIGA